MNELNLKTNSKEQELIKAYLQENVSKILADKINNGVRIFKDNKELVSKKDLDGFFSYANQEARKLAQQGATCACIEDMTVYGWAIHYFEKDSIEGKLFNLDSTEYKPIKKAKVQTKTITKAKKEDIQTSLFDLINKTEKKLLEEQENQRLKEIALSQIDNVETDCEDYANITPEEIDEILAEVAEEEAKQKGTPLYQRFMTVQKAYPTSIICIRLGDFYEFFGESAKTVSNKFDLTLTSRDCGLEDQVPMCGIPYHVADNYFNKIRQNHNLVVIESDKDCDTKYLNAFSKESKQICEQIDLETGEVLTNDTDINNDPICKLKAIFGDIMEVRL